MMASLDAHYSARDIETRVLAAIRAAGLNPEQRLAPEELGALDHFHTLETGGSYGLDNLGCGGAVRGWLGYWP